MAEGVGHAGPQVVLIRHGETEWSKSGQHTGLTDIPLTDVGRKQARAAGERIADRTFARVLASPLGRAVQTCELAGLGEAAQTDEGLLEWDYGAYEGLTTPQIRDQRPDWVLWRDGCPEGETVEQVGDRVDRVIASLNGLDGDAALFAHGHVLRVLAARWLQLDAIEGRRLALSTATLSVLGHERENACIWLWNG